MILVGRIHPKRSHKECWYQNNLNGKDRVIFSAILRTKMIYLSYYVLVSKHMREEINLRFHWFHWSCHFRSKIKYNLCIFFMIRTAFHRMTNCFFIFGHGSNLDWHSTKVCVLQKAVLKWSFSAPLLKIIEKSPWEINF